MGDFNIHINDLNDFYAIKFLNMLDDNCLENIVDGPTHKSGNTIDLIIQNARSPMAEILEIKNYPLSDHSLILFDIKIPSQ